MSPNRLPAKKATEKKATFLLGKKSYGKKSHQIGEKSQIIICLIYHIVPILISHPSVLIGEKQTLYVLIWLLLPLSWLFFPWLFFHGFFSHWCTQFFCPSTFEPDVPPLTVMHISLLFLGILNFCIPKKLMVACLDHRKTKERHCLRVV